MEDLSQSGVVMRIVKEGASDDPHAQNIVRAAARGDVRPKLLVRRGAIKHAVPWEKRARGGGVATQR
jgi:hypothetical protein